MTTLAIEIPSRRKPGRKRIPGKMTVDNQTGVMGIYVKDCDHGWPVILPAREFEVLAQRGRRTQKSYAVRLIKYFLEARNV